MPREKRAPELLSAYVDGVAELTPSERRSLDEELADDAALRAEAAETRDLIAKLRGLPREGGEPDWSALERSIGEAVGTEVPRPWWRRLRWRWIAPGMALAAGAAIALLALRGPGSGNGGDASGSSTEAALAAGVGSGAAAADDRAVTPEAAGGETMALWLDGEGVEGIEVELAAEELLDVPWESDANGEDLLPASDLAWIDELDDEALDRAEAWLADPGANPPAQRKRS